MSNLKTQNCNLNVKYNLKDRACNLFISTIKFCEYPYDEKQKSFEFWNGDLTFDL